jgi:hypothetical protein
MRHFLQKLTLGLVSFAFTGLAFVNTYEVAFNKDVAFAQSLHKLTSQVVINKAVNDFTTKPGLAQSEFTTNLGSLQYFAIPSLQLRVQLEDARKINNLWYTRPSFGHYIGLNRDARNITVDYLIYTQQSWRTIPKASQLDVGMEIELYSHNDTKVIYRVAEKKVRPANQTLVIDKSEGRQIVLITEDAQAGIYYGFSLVQET